MGQIEPLQDSPELTRWTYHAHPSGNGGYWTRPVNPEIVAQMPVLIPKKTLLEKTGEVFSRFIDR